MELIIVRHGETIANTKNLIQGQTHGSLSRLGKLQAVNVAKMLKDENINIIFSSDLRRARQTVKEIEKHHNAPVINLKWLRGRNSGRFEGKQWDYAVKALGYEKAFKDIDFDFEGGESMGDLEERIAMFINMLKKNHKNETILICTHRHCVTVLLSVIFGISIRTMLDNLENIKNAQIIDNTEVVRIFFDKRWHARYLGNNSNITNIIESYKRIGHDVTFPLTPKG